MSSSCTLSSDESPRLRRFPSRKHKTKYSLNLLGQTRLAPSSLVTPRLETKVLAWEKHISYSRKLWGIVSLCREQQAVSRLESVLFYPFALLPYNLLFLNINKFYWNALMTAPASMSIFFSRYHINRSSTYCFVVVALRSVCLLPLKIPISLPQPSFSSINNNSLSAESGKHNYRSSEHGEVIPFLHSKTSALSSSPLPKHHDCCPLDQDSKIFLLSSNNKMSLPSWWSYRRCLLFQDSWYNSFWRRNLSPSFVRTQ